MPIQIGEIDRRGCKLRAQSQGGDKFLFGLGAVTALGVERSQRRARFGAIGVETLGGNKLGGRTVETIAISWGLPWRRDRRKQGNGPDADAAKLPNMAGRLKDGEQVKVAFAKTTSSTVVTRVNLNTATLEELETVPGFTEAFAQDCIDYRTNFGGFQNTRELVDVLGMSEADYVIARRYLTL